MAKFEVLQPHQRFITSVLRIDVQPQKNQWIKPSNRYFTSTPVYLIILPLVGGLLSRAVRILYGSHDFSADLYAALGFISMSQTITIFLSMGLNMGNIINLYQTLQAIVDGNVEIEQIRNIFWRAEQKYRKFIRRIVIFCIVYDQSAFVSAFVYSIYCICMGNYDASAWPVVFELSVPFDTKTIHGWYLLWIITKYLDFAYWTCLILSTGHFIGFCIYIRAICEHFEFVMQAINTSVEQNLHETNQQKYKDTGDEINQRIREAIQIHVQIYEIFGIVADVNSASIFALMPPNALAFGIKMYQIHQIVIGGDFSGVMVYILTLASSLLWPYFFCYFADSVTDRITNIQRSVYDLNWYDFPPELQKKLILIMAQSQTYINFTGLDLILCTLSNFEQLIRRAISYYLAFNVISNL